MSKILLIGCCMSAGKRDVLFILVSLSLVEITVAASIFSVVLSTIGSLSYKVLSVLISFVLFERGTVIIGSACIIPSGICTVDCLT